MAETIDLAKLVVAMEAQSAKYLRDLTKSRKATKKWRKKTVTDVRAVGKTFRNLAVAAGIGLLARKIINSAATQQRAMAQLRAGWKSTGGVVGRSVDEMIADAERLQKITIFGDEQIIEAQSQLITFTNVAEEQFDRATMAALNLAARMGTDLKSAVLQLGKVLNAPASQLSALSRSGIQFNEVQTAMIRKLTKSGNLVAAQTIILNELEVQFGGAAEAARDNFGGALQGLGNAFGDLLEGNGNQGGLNDSTAKIEELTTMLQDPATIQAIDTLTGALITGFSTAFIWIAKTVDKVQDLATDLARFVTGNPKLLAEQAEDLKEEIQDIQDLLERPAGIFAPEVVDDLVNKLRRLKQELAEIEGTIKFINRDQTDPTTPGGAGQTEIIDPLSDESLGINDDAYGAAIDKEIEYYAERARLAEEFSLTQARIENDIFDTRMDLAANALDLVARTAKEGSALQKVAFIAARGIAMAQAIINSQVAAMAALAPPPVGLGPVLGIPLSATIITLGYASAALIAAQSIASFDGGGETGPGLRIGGLDGKGGFLAMMHPNETVIDHTVGGGETNNFYDMRGSELSEARVMQMIEQANLLQDAENARLRSDGR